MRAPILPIRRGRRRAIRVLASTDALPVGRSAPETCFLTGVALVASFLGASARESSQAPQDDEKLARVTCAGCHAFPPPEILPRDRWRDEFVRMMFIRENRLPPIGPPETVYRSVQLPPDMAQVLSFYVARAPERLPAPDAWPDPGETPVRFVRHGLTMPEMPGLPAVSNVSLVDFDGDGRLDVLGTDMRQGVVFTGRPSPAGGDLSVVASIPYPSHATFVDLDRDGIKDLLVGDMGAFFPADHKKGPVIWLRGLGKGKFSAALWLDDWPRVADVETADFNGDGKNDLAIAAFGWRTTGHVTIAENRTTNPAQPSSSTTSIDKRSGAIHMIPADLNGDAKDGLRRPARAGARDRAGLHQQGERRLLVRPEGHLRRAPPQLGLVRHPARRPRQGRRSRRAADPRRHVRRWDREAVPRDSVAREQGRLIRSSERTLAQMPGVHRAEAADMDGDGDLDIVACALLAGGSDVDEKTLPALVWLEQTTPGTFVRHTIEMGIPRHATLDVGDIDGDGDIDIVVGNFWITETRAPGWVDVWTNQLKARGR